MLPKRDRSRATPHGVVTVGVDQDGMPRLMPRDLRINFASCVGACMANETERSGRNGS